SQNVSCHNGLCTQLAWLYVSLGDLERGATLSAQAVEQTRSGFAHFLAWPLAVRTLLEIRQGRLSEAEVSLAEGEAALREIGILFLPGMIGLSRLELLLAKGEWVAGLEAAEHTLARFAELNIRM